MPHIDGPEVWRAADIERYGEWRFCLDSGTAAEMAAAARKAVTEAPSPQSVDRRHFRIPGAADFCCRLQEALELGSGFVVVAGLPLGDLTYDEQVALVLGLSDHVGRVVPQNYELQRIVDVCDEGIEYSHRSRGYRSNKHLPFHTDGAHLFSLTCLGVGAEGGETVIASASAVYNKLEEEHPDALAILCRGFYHHRRGQHDPGEPPLSPNKVPVFAFYEGLLHCCYNRNPIEWAQKENVALSDEEIDALDTLDTVLASKDMQLRLNLQPGESAFINNYITMHSRTEYVDDDTRRRHMLRVWMTDPKSRRNGYNLLQLYVPKRAYSDLIKTSPV